jgi:hypothetical protein
MAAADDGTTADVTQCGKRTDCHPITSGRSHQLVVLFQNPFITILISILSRLSCLQTLEVFLMFVFAETVHRIYSVLGPRRIQ